VTQPKYYVAQIENCFPVSSSALADTALVQRVI